MWYKLVSCKYIFILSFVINWLSTDYNFPLLSHNTDKRELAEIADISAAWWSRHCSINKLS